MDPNLRLWKKARRKKKNNLVSTSDYDQKDLSIGWVFLIVGGELDGQEILKEKKLFKQGFGFSEIYLIKRKKSRVIAAVAPQTVSPSYFLK